MIQGAIERLSYLRYAFRVSSWRWLAARLDSLVLDHLEPWGTIQRGFPAYIHPSVSFRSGHNIAIGAHTRIQKGCVVWASPGSRIVIGDHTGLGPGAMIFSSNHRYEPGIPYHEQPWREEDVTIGNGVWVGAGVRVLPGVTVGDGSVIAAGSVVTRDVPADTLVAGVPARVIRLRELTGG